MGTAVRDETLAGTDLEKGEAVQLEDDVVAALHATAGDKLLSLILKVLKVLVSLFGSFSVAS